MFYLKKFANSTAYLNYLASDDQWRPSVAYVVNNHVENIDPTTGKDLNMDVSTDWYTDGGNPTSQSVKRYVDFQDLGQHFIEVFNNGTMYFWDMKNASRTIGGVTEQLGDFYATVDSSGVLNINVPTTSQTVDGSAWHTLDSSGELNFWNFPEQVAGTYRWTDKDNVQQEVVIS